MNTSQFNGRRRFLGGLSLGAAAGALSYHLGDSQPSTPPRALDAQLPLQFEQMLLTLRGIPEVPNGLLQRYGQPLEVYAWLMGRLGRAPGAEISDLPNAVHERIVADYRDGLVCDFHGWPMSETECALIVARAQNGSSTTLQERTIENAREATWIAIRNWGPRSTQRGDVFNPQPDGHGGIWFQASGDLSSTVVVIDGGQSSITLSHSGFTTGVSGEALTSLINDVGPHVVWAYDFSRHQKQRLGEFVVDP